MESCAIGLIVLSSEHEFCGNVGMHDADGWRHEYGGQIYKTNGSHGCVNMPKAAARTVYNTLEIGSAVVVY